jgi:formylglycine-generating enzyme required for sulfatase activity
MIFVKGGKFNFGSDTGLDREKPEREVIIQSFLIDKNLVTVEDFRSFVNVSNYITEAEIFGNAIVYDDSINIWQLVDGPKGNSQFAPSTNCQILIESSYTIALPNISASVI